MTFKERSILNKIIHLIVKLILIFLHLLTLIVLLNDFVEFTSQFFERIKSNESNKERRFYLSLIYENEKSEREIQGSIASILVKILSIKLMLVLTLMSLIGVIKERISLVIAKILLDPIIFAFFVILQPSVLLVVYIEVEVVTIGLLFVFIFLVKLTPKEELKAKV